jgi:DNA-binding transcriptional regulator LsrR (DeoR family)
MVINSGDFSNLRLINRVLVMYFAERLNQTEIGKKTGLSTVKVNRLIKQARDSGLVEIHINTPLNRAVELERKIEKITGLQEVAVIPTLSEDENTLSQNLGHAAAKFLLEHLRPGDIICMGGGRAIFEMVKAVQTDKTYNVQIVPAIGGIQGNHYTDVNYLAAELARKIGGTAHQLHAPAFVDSPEEKNILISLRHVKEVLNLARKSTIALFGIGSIIPNISSYFQFTNFSSTDINYITNQEEGIGEILARVYDVNGSKCANNINDRVVGLSMEDLVNIPVKIGVAGSAQKTPCIIGALAGRIINSLITDEFTGQEIIKHINNNS